MAPYQIPTIAEYHKILGLAKPLHPLLSIIRQDNFKPRAENQQVSVTFGFYLIALKHNVDGRPSYSYGQGSYDFDDGVLFFLAPGQVFSFKAEEGVTFNGAFQLRILPNELTLDGRWIGFN